jgi:hypothetical protein
VKAVLIERGAYHAYAMLAPLNHARVALLARGKHSAIPGGYPRTPMARNPRWAVSPRDSVTGDGDLACRPGERPLLAKAVFPPAYPAISPQITATLP